jgi:N-acetylglucosaminyl-diphospho-decaprenol L-rhamnosyltransferase
MGSRFHVDAITVTYNSGETLRNLLQCQPLRAAFDQIIVVDAGSSDGSAEMAARLGARALHMLQPSGYGACVNHAVSHTRGEVFAVLNPDILLEDETVPGRLEQLMRNEHVGIAAPSLRLPDGSLQDSARNFPTLPDLITRRRFAARHGEIQTSGPVPWVVGAFMVFRRAAFEVVGGFDESYFMYFEDVDICWRMRRAGFSTVLDTSAVALHDHQRASRGPVWHPRTRAHIRSALRFYARNPRFAISRDPALGRLDADRHENT